MSEKDLDSSMNPYQEQQKDTNHNELECDFVSMRVVELLDQDNFELSVDYLKYIHKYLFQDIYGFAGEFRKIDFSKHEKILNNDLIAYREFKILTESLEYDISLEKENIDEKIGAVLRCDVFNSGIKEFYDTFYFFTKLRKETDINLLKETVDNTFTKRNSFEHLNDCEQIINSTISNERLEKLWNIYNSKYKYAGGIDINEIFNLLKDIIKKLDLVIVAS